MEAALGPPVGHPGESLNGSLGGEAPGFNRFVSKVRLLRHFSRDYNVKMIKLKTLKGLI